MSENSETIVVTEKFDKEVDDAVKNRNNTLNEGKNIVESLVDINSEHNLNAIPKKINDDYNEINGKYFLKNDPGTLAFVDKGQKIQAKLSNPKIAKSLVSIAEERTWTELKVTGSKEFKHHVWLEASQRGMTVKGYKPSEADLAELKQKTNNQFNEIAKNKKNIKSEVIKDKSQEPEDISKEHPDLVNEVAAIKIAEKFSQNKFSNETDRDRFVTEVRNNLASDIENGQQNIEVKLNEQQVVEPHHEKEEKHER